MKSKKSLSDMTCFILLGGSALFLGSPARAQPVWTHVASTCVVDEASASSYLATDPKLGFNNGTATEIVTRCNVINPMDSGKDPQWNFLEIVYVDPDGMNTQNQVLATLTRVTNAGVHVPVATFNSDHFASAAAPLINGALFSHTFDFLKNAYYVEIKLKRPGVGSSPAALLVRLKYDLI
jgi:hypothetical protein